MFGIVLIVVATLMHLYVFWRAGSVPAIARRVPRRVLGATGVGLWSCLVASRFLTHEASAPLARAFESFGMNWLAAVFLLFVALLAVDLLTGFGFALPRLAPKLRGGALALGASLAVFGAVQGLRPPVVREHEIQLRGLPAELDGTVLVALSDLHLGSQFDAGWLAERAEQVRALRPDLVVLLGDNFDGRHGPADELRPIFRSLAAPLGVWAVLGNHDLHRGEAVGVELLESSGIRLLRDGSAEVRPGLVLAGVDDLTRRGRAGRIEGFVSAALAGRPPGATILLSHTPWRAEEAAGAGAALMLSGHTHGGQLWPFGYLVAQRYPLLAGRYQVAGMQVLVSRGTGLWGPRMRLWQPGEILRITLRAQRS